MKLTRTIPLVLVSGVALALFASPFFEAENQAAPRSEDPAVPVVTTRVTRADLREVYRTIGTVAGRTEVKISAQIPGLLREVLVKPGDRIKRGQTLAVLDERVPRAELAQAESAFKRSTEELQRVRQLVDLGIAETKRLEAAVSQNEIDRATMDKFQTQLSNNRFLSPFDGVVTSQYAYPGDTLQNGSAVLSLSDVTRLRVMAKVPDSVASRLARGSQAVLEAAESDEIRATVTEVYPAADPVSHQTVVELDAGNAFPRLQPGFLVKIQLTLADLPQALVLDRRAVPDARRGDSVELVVVRDGHAERRAVKLGLIVDDRAEIVSGLTENDVVVMRGGAQLADGAPVRIVAGQGAPETGR